MVDADQLLVGIFIGLIGCLIGNAVLHAVLSWIYRPLTGKRLQHVLDAQARAFRYSSGPDTREDTEP